MNKRKLLFTIMLATIFAVPLIVSAQATQVTLNPVDVTAQAPFVPLAQYPAGSNVGNLYNGSPGDLSGYINTMFTIAISVGAMLAVLRLVYAGYIYMLKDSFSMKQNAKEIIGNTVFGLLLLLAIYLILNQINPCILNLNIANDFSGGSSCSSGYYQSSPGAVF